MAGVLIRGGKLGHRRSGGKAMWRQSQRLEVCICKPRNARIAGRDQEPGRRKQGRPVPWSLQREHGPADSWISLLWPPEPQENKLPLFLAPLFAVLCYVCPRKGVQDLTRYQRVTDSLKKNRQEGEWRVTGEGRAHKDGIVQSGPRDVDVIWALAATTKYHRPDGLKTDISHSPGSWKVLDQGPGEVSFIPRPLLLSWRRPPSTGCSHDLPFVRVGNLHYLLTLNAATLGGWRRRGRPHIHSAHNRDLTQKLARLMMWKIQVPLRARWSQQESGVARATP